MLNPVWLKIRMGTKSGDKVQPLWVQHKCWCREISNSLLSSAWCFHCGQDQRPSWRLRPDRRPVEAGGGASPAALPAEVFACWECVAAQRSLPLQCHPSGCLTDLFIQMAIIMVLKQTISNVFEFAGP